MILETFGSIIKEEQVKTVERGSLPNTFVLENLGYFPGYYGAELPHDKDPDSIFLVMNQKESTEKILRITDNIKKISGFAFEGTPADLYVNNSTYYSIRIRGIKDFDDIGVLQEFYRDEGITFAKAKKIDEMASIQVKKIFRVETFAQDIFKDANRNMYYFKIEHQLTWSHFKTITRQVRNNVKISAFDAALAVIYGSVVHDMVRVYTKSLSKEELQKLHEKYKELIAKSLK
ncbi:MAG: hypothetical protein JEZ09_04300 [Salinivirgaceae bacterium]|nr:hypothetical protein [Salinivirgaceae bacterium]